MALWNPWHGCRKLSEGCQHCYVYRSDSRHGRDSSIPQKNSDFDLPVRKNRSGAYKLAPGETVNTCFTSDFLLDLADEWRGEAWAMMRERRDLNFFFITKRIDRLENCLPDDWGDGWDNVCIGCTVENQKRADYRLPIFSAAPIKHKIITCEPLLEAIDLEKYLGGWIEKLVAGGESGNEARLCDYSWILSLREQCLRRGVPFWFKQTGAHFKKDGKVYNVPRRYQHSQAKKAGINHVGRGIDGRQ